MSGLAFQELSAVPDDGPLLEEIPDLLPFSLPGSLPPPSLPRGRARPRPLPRTGRTAPLLPDEPALFPWLARRFAPGEATLWTGVPLAVEPLLELVYAGSASAGSRISLVEGANRFHPYRIGELGRSFGIDATETLRRIRLARAFTAYQLVALVAGWAAEIRRHPADLLIGHDLPALFTSDEIPAEERAELLRHVARVLAELLREVRAPLLLTLGSRGHAEFPGLSDEGPPWCDLVTFARGPGTVRARSLRSDARLVLVPRPGGQHGIEEYGGGSPEEVVAWGVPPRRTVKRSRSG
ncbi:MAG TPA: hypothetical protein VEK13_06465 [Thermoplasmata archaeon]|nr:hypothetical protein [Thermoplasmata archaeon]